MRAIGIIPARFASRRFPGKVLSPIAGLPMLQRVWEGARNAKRLHEVVVASDDDRVLHACAEFGARGFRTREEHLSGSDRVAEVARGLDDEIVVNVQGDEPLIEGFVVDAAVEALLETPEAPLATVAHLAPADAQNDPNRVEVEIGSGGFAQRFVRFGGERRQHSERPAGRLQHVGVYAYRRQALLDFVALPPGRLEREHRLEQLRALERGWPIRVAIIEGWQSLAVDVPEDVAPVEERIQAGAREERAS